MYRTATGFIRTVGDPAPIRAWCPDCQSARCVCHGPYCRDCGKAVCSCREARAAENIAAPDTVIPLGEVAPPVQDGLIIEGIATTRDWNAVEVPLAAGLRRLDGSTTYRRRGLDPRKFSVVLPLPLLWHHQKGKPLGEMFALSATDLAVHFKACIVPPGTANYDSALLERVWADVRSGKAAGVSFHTNIPKDDGTWSGVELSVCENPGNQYAIITRAVFPDKHIVTRAAPNFDLADAQRAWLSFDARTNPKTSPVTKQIVLKTDEHGVAVGATVTEGGTTTIASVTRSRADVQARSEETAEKRTTNAAVPATYQGVWKPDAVYNRGNMATHDGCLWHAEADGVTDRPGTSPRWKLMHKSMEKAKR